jgi:chemotaxis protein methyltransferase CheR
MNNLTKSEFKRLSDFVYRKTGIFLEESKHYDKLNNFVLERQKTLNLNEFRKYLFLVRFKDRDGEEFQKLINALTVNETYFFRENHQFEVLTKNILSELHKIRPKSEVIRILSAPCSTGEEPYSIVIHIVEEKNILSERNIEIVGIDIDSNVIQKACDARYSNRSVHAVPKDIFSKYFEKIDRIYNQFSQELQEVVDFRVVNVFDNEELEKLGKFDVIFSRNMMIYFDDQARKQVAMNFYNILKPNGFVLLGHAEYMSRIVSVYNIRKFGNVITYVK